VEGAAYLFTNEYETSLLLKETGWSESEVLDRVGYWVKTYGPEGVRIESKDTEPLVVPAVKVIDEVDPTGVGDAFRAGFLWGLHAKLSLERSAQVGCTLAAIVLETVGTQEYTLDRAEFSKRVAVTYGGDAAAEIESKLRV
jgi:adenosine kinase